MTDCAYQIWLVITLLHRRLEQPRAMQPAASYSEPASISFIVTSTVDIEPEKV